MSKIKNDSFCFELITKTTKYYHSKNKSRVDTWEIQNHKGKSNWNLK